MLWRDEKTPSERREELVLRQDSSIDLPSIATKCANFMICHK